MKKRNVADLFGQDFEYFLRRREHHYTPPSSGPTKGGQTKTQQGGETMALKRRRGAEPVFSWGDVYARDAAVSDNDFDLYARYAEVDDGTGFEYGY